jgi:hypothetical protein
LLCFDRTATMLDGSFTYTGIANGGKPQD